MIYRYTSYIMDMNPVSCTFFPFFLCHLYFNVAYVVFYKKFYSFILSHLNLSLWLLCFMSCLRFLSLR